MLCRRSRTQRSPRHVHDAVLHLEIGAAALLPLGRDLLAVLGCTAAAKVLGRWYRLWHDRPVRAS